MKNKRFYILIIFLISFSIISFILFWKINSVILFLENQQNLCFIYNPITKVSTLNCDNFSIPTIYKVFHGIIFFQLLFIISTLLHLIRENKSLYKPLADKLMGVTN